METREEVKRLELAEKLLKEGLELVRKGDSVQASEKLYKAAEECIKAIAHRLGLEEAKEAAARGRWTARLLDRAAKALSEIVDRRIYDDWDHAYFLHVEGFHEMRLDIEQVKNRVKFIEELLNIANDIIKNNKK